MNAVGSGGTFVPMTSQTTLHFIDSSSRSRAELARLGFQLGHHCEVYADCRELAVHTPTTGIILARDGRGEDCIANVIRRLGRYGVWLPVIAVVEQPEPARIVDAIKAGALDYLSLPLEAGALQRCLGRIGDEAEEFSEARRRMIDARNRIAVLSKREREVLDQLMLGGSNKAIARELSISPRTVEIHRANMMSKLGANHAADAVRLRFEAQLEGKKG